MLVLLGIVPVGGLYCFSCCSIVLLGIVTLPIKRSLVLCLVCFVCSFCFVVLVGLVSLIVLFLVEN